MGADFLISFTDLLGDFVLIYRCWMIWGKDYYIIVLPLLTSIAGFGRRSSPSKAHIPHFQSLACIIAVLDLLITINPTSPTPPPELVPLGLAGYTLPLCTNIIVTSLIVYRIWSTSRAVPDSPLDSIGSSVTRRAMMLIIESGALYLLFQLVFVVLFAIPHPAEAILAVMTVQIYVSNASTDSKPISKPDLFFSQGIAPTLIIIRVGLGISSENPSGTVASTRLKWIVGTGEQTGTSTTDSTYAISRRQPPR